MKLPPARFKLNLEMIDISCRPSEQFHLNANLKHSEEFNLHNNEHPLNHVGQLIIRSAVIIHNNCTFYILLLKENKLSICLNHFKSAIRLVKS